MMLWWVLIALFWAINVYDVVSTYLIINAGGDELNLLVKKLMEWFGVLPGMLMLKIPCLLLLTLSSYSNLQTNFKTTIGVLCGLNLIYFLLMYFFNYQCMKNF